jgi:hypothetical protein
MGGVAMSHGEVQAMHDYICKLRDVLPLLRELDTLQEDLQKDIDVLDFEAIVLNVKEELREKQKLV